MNGARLARLGLSFGLIALFGCAPVPAPQATVAPAPVAVVVPPPPPPPAPVALVQPPPARVAVAVPPPPPVVTPPPPPAPKVAHVMIHHRRWVRRYAMRTDTFGAACGSDAHPCSVSHIVVRLQ